MFGGSVLVAMPEIDAEREYEIDFAYGEPVTTNDAGII